MRTFGALTDNNYQSNQSLPNKKENLWKKDCVDW
jgi:hypothetical protein